jgi:chromosomal replication initiation ATPase DnaA
MASQIPLPLQTPAKLGRADFIVGPGNSAAVAFVDKWPDWPAPAAAVFGPPGSGKSHLACVWAERAGARIVTAADLADESLAQQEPLVIENVDAGERQRETDSVLFALIERGHSMLLTAHEPPGRWSAGLPDLRSRFDALLAFPLWAPDEALLEALARKLFADRQLTVPDAVIAQMIRALERSPAAVRDFVARADAAALAQKRAVNLGLIRELLAAG